MGTIWIISVIVSILILGTLGISQFAQAGVFIPIGATTTWIGDIDGGDGQNWSDPLNWDRQQLIEVVSLLGNNFNVFNHSLPEICDLIIIDNNDSNPVTVHFDIPFFQLGNEMEIGVDDTLVIDTGRVFDHTPTPGLCQPLNLNEFTIVNNGNLIVFGSLINNGNFINNGQVRNCGIVSGTFLIPGTVNPCQQIGGTLIPIDTTTLLLAGVQSISMWMIPVVVAGVGIGVFVIIRRK